MQQKTLEINESLFQFNTTDKSIFHLHSVQICHVNGSTLDTVLKSKNDKTELIRALTEQICFLIDRMCQNIPANKDNVNNIPGESKQCMARKIKINNKQLASVRS